MKYAVLGCGVAGTLVCLELLHSGVDPSQILLIDTHFDGGSLGRNWGGIQSNTTWSQIKTAMENYPSARNAIDRLSEKYQDTNTCSLHDLSWILFESLQVYTSKCEVVVGRCEKIQQDGEGWKLYFQSKSFFVETVFLCQGGKQKELDYGKPILQLETIFDLDRCKRYIQPNDVVTVFGTAHSGTLALRNLLTTGCRIFAVYRGSTPFVFARDNNYDGIKQESAEIADAIQATKPHQLQFVHANDIPMLFKAVQRSKWILNCTGFETNSLPILTNENQPLSEFHYSPETAEIAPNVYGFGLAYPGVTTVEGKVYKDVSIPSFVEQIRRVLPSILSKNNTS